MEELQIKEILDKNVKQTNSSDSIQLHIFYRNKKLKNLVIKTETTDQTATIM